MIYMQNLYKILTFLALFLCVGSAFAQKATLKGKMIDGKSKEALIGATVFVVVQGENTVGAVSDFDGNYEMAEIPAGTFKLVASYVGYASDTTEMTFADGQALTKDFELGEEVTVLQGVLIVGKASRSTTAALTMIQQKSPSLVTGITNQEIQRSPDRSTADVLKRVSGTSVQDNKFVVIRGLADRYNIATVNGLVLPSTEPDRRAFSFDLIPSALLSNLLIYKTATPELPGEFAGGVITVNTRETPDEPFVSLSINAGYNTQSTFKAYDYYPTGKTDWLGYDNETRALPEGVTKAGLENNATRFEQSKKFANDWKIANQGNLPPTWGFQLAAGTQTKLFKKELGMIGALTYNNTQRILDVSRGDYEVTKQRVFDYNDQQIRKNITVGSMLNFALRLSPNSKISWNNLLSSNGSDEYVFRSGRENDQSRLINAYSMFYNATRLFTSQLLGEHAIGEKGTKLNWSLGTNDIDRNTPSLRRITYLKNEDQLESDPYSAFVPFGTPSPNFAGRFYSNQGETSQTANLKLTIPYGKKAEDEDKQSNFKLGAFAEIKDREFDARVFGYTVTSTRDFNFDILNTPVSTIFDPKNIGQQGFTIRESTNPNDSYTAGSDLSGGFLMLDHYLSEKFRVIFGARVENFVQKLDANTFGGTPINFAKTTTDVLPSLNLSYALTKQSNLRFAVSQTVCRPNFRELAPFTFYDFNLAATIDGNPDLVRTKVTNFDLKYELFPTPSESVSLTAFYKDFKDPIEAFYEALGGGGRNFSFKNAPTAQNFGLELEVRYKLNRLGSALENSAVFSNLAWINSNLDVSNDPLASVNGDSRPLQGQSPYIINLGFSYATPKNDLNATLLFNRIGRRIWLVGSNGYRDTYENPRNVLDFQVTKKILKNKGELKFNAQDILNNNAIFYQDQDNSESYDEAEDTVIQNILYGANYSLTFTYRFSR